MGPTNEITRYLRLLSSFALYGRRDGQTELMHILITLLKPHLRIFLELLKDTVINFNTMSQFL
jgi:hypothetical protein